MTLNVRLLTPDRIVREVSVEELVIPSSTGFLGILTDHTPLLTALEIGVARLRTSSDVERIVLMGGFAEIDDNTVTILCSVVEEPDQIDAQKVQDDLAAANQLVAKATTKIEKMEAEIELRKAKARLQVVSP